MAEYFKLVKFIRSDGDTLTLTDEIRVYDDNDGSNLLAAADPNTTSVNYTEADGGEMIRQQLEPYDQELSGLIVPETSSYWTLMNTLKGFFKINYTYKLIYQKRDGSMFAVNNAWISAGLQLPPRPREDYCQWTITFTIGSVYWYEYSEDSSGQETYANSVTLPLLSAASGGESWDEVGLVADTVGEVWTTGTGGVQSVYIDSTTTIYPVWVVEGTCVNPTLQNNTTDSVATYNGSVAAGQTLTVYLEEGTAYLDTALVTRNLSGLVSLQPGENIVGFNSDGGDAESCQIMWNNVIG